MNERRQRWQQMLSRIEADHRANFERCLAAFGLNTNPTLSAALMAEDRRMVAAIDAAREQLDREFPQ